MLKPAPHFASCLLKGGRRAVLAAMFIAMALQARGALATEIVPGADADTILPDVSDTIGLPEVPPSDNVDNAPSIHASPGTHFHLGDRLQIDFFEHIDLGQPTGQGGAGMNTSMRTFYQRLDLTGQYRVDIDGTIAIPLLGRFAIVGRTVDDLREDIKAAFEDQTGRVGEIHISILERQPVFVVGVVRNPGSYSFVPGMIVLQAIALAGGFERVPEVSSRILDMLRERERHVQATQRLKRLKAQRARLIEQRDGAASSEALMAKASDEIKGLLAVETALLEADTAARKGEIGLQDAVLASAQGELVALRESVDLVEHQISVRSERLRVLEQMQGRGIINLEAMWGAQKDVTDFELQREQLAAAIHLAKQKVAQAKLARDKVNLDHQARIARELATTEDEIAQLESTIDASADMTRALSAAVATAGVDPDGEVTIEILRRTADGVATLSADEGTDLMPGDVLKVLKNSPRKSQQLSESGS